MAKISGLNQRLFLDGYDLSGDVGAIDTADSKRSLLEVPGLNKSAMERVNGLADGELSFACWFNPSAGQAHPVLSVLPTADVIAQYLIGVALGDPVAALTAKQVDYDWSRADDGSLKGKVQCLGQGVPLEWGVLLTAGKVTHASATNGAAVDGLAATTAGGAAYLQLFSIASGQVDVTVEDSADGSTGWATIASFTVNLTARKAERVAIAGTIRRYTRVVTADTFTNAVLCVGVARF